MEGKICDQTISFLIDPRYNYSYVSPEIMEECWLAKEVIEKLYLVQLATWTKKRVKH